MVGGIINNRCFLKGRFADEDDSKERLRVREKSVRWTMPNTMEKERGTTSVDVGTWRR